MLFREIKIGKKCNFPKTLGTIKVLKKEIIFKGLRNYIKWAENPQIKKNFGLFRNNDASIIFFILPVVVGFESVFRKSNPAKSSEAHI